MDIPAGWTALVVRTITVAVVAFVMLQAKEWFDARTFDTSGTAVDAGLVAAGILVFYAILMLTKRR
jgi:hypothetical protein